MQEEAIIATATPATELSHFGSFEISQLIKTSQSQNGLKHSDFLRYRRYCCEKVKKIRKALKFTHGKNYQKKQIHLERPNDPKMLHALLYKVEHNWAYAMDLKQTMQNSKDGSKRKQHHVNKKMAKALKWATLLNEICMERADERTYRESEAYSCYISGIYNHERENWGLAIEKYIKARAIYLDLISHSDSLQSVFYREKNEFLEQSIRFCHQQNNGFILDTVEMIVEKMSSQMEIESSSPLKSSTSTSASSSSANQKNIAEKKNQLIEIDYQGSKYPIKNQKALFAYKQIEDCTKRIAAYSSTHAGETEEEQELVLSMFVELFSYFEECIKVIQKEKSDEKNSEAENAIYANVLNFLNLQKLKSIVERNMILIKHAVLAFDKEDGVSNLEFLATKKAFTMKLIRPTKIIKLSDNLLEVFKQVLEIERQSPNLSNLRKYEILDHLFKGVRCYYVSCVYLANHKYIETLSLLKSSENMLNDTARKFPDMETLQIKEYVEFTQQFIKKVRFLEIKAKLGLVENTNEDEEVVRERLAETNLDGKITSKTIQALLKDQEEGISHGISINRISAIPIIALPPKPSLVNLKPIQFDLVDQLIDYPKIDLPSTKQAPQNPTGGLFNKLKFWK